MTTEPPEFSEHEEEAAAPEPPAAPEPVSPEPAAEVVAADDNIFSSGEGMVALAGGLIVVVWFIFEIIVQDYFIGTTVLLLALIALILPRLDRDLVEKLAPLAVLMKITGYLLALAGVLEIIDDLRFDGFDDGFTDILGALGAYAGYAIAFLGARSIDT